MIIRNRVYPNFLLIFIRNPNQLWINFCSIITTPIGVQNYEKCLLLVNSSLVGILCFFFIISLLILGIKLIFRIDGVTNFVKDGDIAKIGNLSIKCYGTPCHTTGKYQWFNGIRQWPINWCTSRVHTQNYPFCT